MDEQRTTRSSVRNTPQRDRRPANRPRKRQGGVDTRHRRRSSTHVVESPSKAAGHSVTFALDAEATAANLGYDRSNKLTGGNEEAALPQREETLQQHSRDNGRMGSKKHPHITPSLTPGSPATLPIPQADRGGQRLRQWPLAVIKNSERDRATDSGHSKPLASKLKLLTWVIAAKVAIDHARAVSEGSLAVRKTTTGPTETTRANTMKTLAVRKPPTLTQRLHKGK